MIREKITRQYQVCCDICDQSASHGATREEALYHASQEGFKHTERHNGLELVKRDLCPHCANPYGE